MEKEVLFHSIYIDYLENKFNKDAVLKFVADPHLEIRSHVKYGYISTTTWTSFLSHLEPSIANRNEVEKVLEASYEYFYTVGNVDLVKTFSKFIHENSLLSFKTRFDYFNNMPITQG